MWGCLHQTCGSIMSVAGLYWVALPGLWGSFSLSPHRVLLCVAGWSWTIDPTVSTSLVTGVTAVSCHLFRELFYLFVFSGHARVLFIRACVWRAKDNLGVLFSSTVWVLGIELGLLGLAVGTFPGWTISLLLSYHFFFLIYFFFLFHVYWYSACMSMRGRWIFWNRSYR